jgi:hypothetical protein
MEAGRDGADSDAVAFGEALDRFAQSVDDADRFVSQRAIGIDRNGPLNRVHVGLTDQGRRGTHHSLIRPGLGYRLLGHLDLAYSLDHERLHRVRGCPRARHIGILLCWETTPSGNYFFSGTRRLPPQQVPLEPLDRRGRGLGESGLGICVEVLAPLDDDQLLWL